MLTFTARCDPLIVNTIYILHVLSKFGLTKSSTRASSVSIFEILYYKCLSREIFFPYNSNRGSWQWLGNLGNYRLRHVTVHQVKV